MVMFSVVSFQIFNGERNEENKMVVAMYQI